MLPHTMHIAKIHDIDITLRVIRVALVHLGSRGADRWQYLSKGVGAHSRAPKSPVRE